MPKFAKIFLLLFLSVLSVTASAQDKEVTLESIYLKPEFTASGLPDYRSMPDGIHYSYLEDDLSINIYEYETGKFVRTLLDGSEFKRKTGRNNIDIFDYKITLDEKKILISTDAEKIYRKSVVSNYYIFDASKNSIIQITKKGKARTAELSPDGNFAAYVIHNNIYILDLASMEEKQITKDGEQNKIINGAPDWVYEEELGLSEAVEWSSDGAKLAYLRFDESGVREFNLTYYGELYPGESKYKYPKAGESNSIVTVHVYDLKNNKSVIADIGKNQDIYIPRIKWTPQGVLSIIRLNRQQNKLDILFADAETGSARTVHTDENKYYIRESYDLHFLKDGRFLHVTDKDGCTNVYLHSKDGSVINRVSDEVNGIGEIKGTDGINEILYYTAYASTPYDRDVFSVKFDGTGKRKISNKSGYNNILFANNLKYYILSNADANTPSSQVLYDNAGREVRTINENRKLKERLKDYKLVKKEFISFETSDGIKLYGWMMKPQQIDPAKKYPLLMYVYGGPGSQSVLSTWGGNDYMWYQMLCGKGYVIACVDGRGTGGRGSEFEKQVYGRMGELELKDQIEAAKYFGGLDFIDRERIGIWGWSFGGYMSSLCITAGADYFSLAVAVAPVTSFRLYDNIYTERYLGLPKDNPEGYDNNAPLVYANKLKGKFLIVHGSADDNVHYQNTAEFVKELISSNKQFEMQIYPDRNHSITGGSTRYHLFKRITGYILNNL